MCSAQSKFNGGISGDSNSWKGWWSHRDSVAVSAIPYGLL